MAATKSSAPKFWLRQSGDRGHAHHGWLKTYHHFPFASYWDPSNPYQTFGALRVINEDRVEPTEGFGTVSWPWKMMTTGDFDLSTCSY